MPSVSVNYLIVVVFAVILVDVFCTESNASTRRTNAWQTPDQKTLNVLPSGQSTTTSTTPWPALGQRYTVRPNRNRQTTSAPNRNQQTTASNRKWIQQNNIWIRNEQASAQGDVKSTTTTSSRPPLRRGETYTVIDPKAPQQTNKQQQSLLDGLHNSQLDVGPITPKTPANKPTTVSYAGVVGPASTTQKTKISSTWPLGDGEKNPESNDDKATGNSDVTDDELREFAETLLRKDTNNAMKYVTVNWQGKTSSRLEGDEAPLPLLKIDDAAFKIPSIEKIMLLYNNYFLDAGQNEVYTGQERIEENNFLDAVLSTPVMQFTRSFLVQKGKIGKDPKEFRDLLRQIWFNMYSRGGGKIGSSGFEHVFVAEIKENQVSGLHNWIYFYDAEAQNKANYLGYLKKIDLGDKGAILKHHSTFHDISKPVNSMFIGTSPELELALYSTCFILRADRICPLKMNGNRFIIRTYTFRYRGKNMIGSAFPEI
ncbi:endoribonuclease CG2145-like [Anthonomus grandis grandis]|uniref:endoribonuclease CG2145-like n=1 Tax=Anthonomus grandis grandis TaxID=2921223 RepID=UPI0021657023|nr:endoribonuclease CG2145-like [Anthonomus grandis grandis]